MKYFLLLIFFLLSANLQARNVIAGRVRDEKKNPLPGANIFVEDSYDGASSDSTGYFRFSTAEKGVIQLIIASVGYSTSRQIINVDKDSIFINIYLKEASINLSEITISAGSFIADPEKKDVVLSSLDVLTTAGSTGDIFGAVQTLPGAQAVAEDGRLFIRGGNWNEAKTYLDGMLIANPFEGTTAGVPTRGRLNPMLVKGSNFSTGGYSAEYGQALSSALILTSKDMPVENQTDISLMAVGAEVAHTVKRTRSSWALGGSYLNLKPLFSVVPQNINWKTEPSTEKAYLIYNLQTSKTGMLKLYAYYSRGRFVLNQNDNNVSLSNNYLFSKISYKTALSDKWSTWSGVSVTTDKNDTDVSVTDVEEPRYDYHLKYAMQYDPASTVSLKFGVENISTNYSIKYTQGQSSQKNKFTENLTAGFIEADMVAFRKLAFRAGARMEYSYILAKMDVVPRISMAYKVNDASQFSVAYGKFYQLPEKEYLRQTSDLQFELADHYIANYQVQKNNRTLRIEGFYKKYNSLTTFTSIADNLLEGIKNDGYGFSKGVELWLRDKKTIKNTDYWISYSWLKAERKYEDFPVAIIPSFARQHNVSVVVKHFVPPIRTQFGATWQWMSGEQYTNPNFPGIQNKKTPAYRNFSINASYLFRQNIIFHVLANNLFGFDQIMGYKFDDQPDERGVFASQPIYPSAKRFLFAGIFITLTKDKKANQLDEL